MHLNGGLLVTRSQFMLFVSLAGILASTTEAQAGKKLYVGNLPFSAADGFAILDKSTPPATAVMDATLSLSGRTGTLQNPGSPLATSSTLGIINPGLDGLGDAGFIDVFYDGPAGDFPATSYFDLVTAISEPNSLPPQYGQSSQKAAGDGDYLQVRNFKVDISGIVAQDLELLYEINPNQIGLRFGVSSLEQPTPSSIFNIFTELQFDGPGPIDPSLPLFRVTVSSVPEPSTAILAAMGAAALMLAHKRRARRELESSDDR